MATRIIPKKSTVAAKVPLDTDLEIGEIAINLTDRKIYSKNASNQVVEIGGAGAGFDQDLNTTDDVSFNSVSTDTLQITGGTGTQGTITWNPDEETIDVITNGSVTQVGQELVWNVKNQTGSTIPNGTPVMATGTVGTSGRITVAPMDGTNPANVKYFLGVTTEEILDGADGKITHFGKVRDINTSAYTEGTVLYISTTTAGAFQTTEPSYTDLNLPVAFVITSHANNGVLAVRVKNIDVNAFQPYNANTVIDGSYVHTDNNYTTTEKNKLSGIESGATADQTPAEILTAIKTVDGAASGLDADLLDGQQGSYYLDWTNVTNKPDPVVTLSGDVSGSATMTDLGSITITATIADDSHNHIISNVDGLQTALDGKLNTTGDGIIYGDLEINGGNGPAQLIIRADADNVTETDTATILLIQDGGIVSSQFGIDDSNHAYLQSNYSGTHVILKPASGASYISSTSNRIFADNYHPNADKLTTSRVITLAGDVSGSASFDGSANITINATVADDSHNHTIANVDGLQSALNSKANLSGSTSQTFNASVLNATVVNAGTVDLGNWTITETAGGELMFASGGVNKMKLDANGNLDVVGNVNTNATL